MKKVTMFSLQDSLLLVGCIEMATNSWKKWVREDNIPEGWDLSTALAMITSLATLQEKVSSFSQSSEEPRLTEEDFDEFENAQNILLFPTPEA